MVLHTAPFSTKENGREVSSECCMIVFRSVEVITVISSQKASFGCYQSNTLAK